MTAQQKLMFSHTRRIEKYIPALLTYKTEMKFKYATGLTREAVRSEKYRRPY